MPDTTARVLAEVSYERDRQDQKWGEQNHSPFHWLVILMEEVGEASKEACESYVRRHQRFPTVKEIRFSRYRAEMVQVAAVAVAAIESLDRGKWDETSETTVEQNLSPEQA